MNASRWMKASSFFLLIIFIGHTIGTLAPMNFGPAGDAVLTAMKTFKFDMVGSERSYWHFYYGGSLSISLFVLLEVLIIWFLSDFVSEKPQKMSRILTVLLLGNIAFAVLSQVYYFIVPAACAGLASVCLAMALIAVQKNPMTASKV